MQSIMQTTARKRESAGVTGELERRGAARAPVDWTVKVGADGVRYLAGRTRNVSAGGALLRLEGPTGPRLQPGQRVRLGFADRTGPGVLATARMVEATVLRRVDHGEGQEVAVRFAVPQVLSKAG